MYELLFLRLKGGKFVMRNKRENGITLIALVITIIVLLILAGITISNVLGENGIISKATKAKFQTEVASVKEEFILANSFNEFEESKEFQTGLRVIDLITGYKGYSDNCLNNMSMIQSLIQFLEEDYSMLGRMEEILIQASNDTNQEIDINACFNEIEQLLPEINRVSNDANFNGLKIMLQEKNEKLYYDLDNYIDINFWDFSTKGLNINNISSSNISGSLQSAGLAKSTIENRINYYKNLENKLNTKSSELSKKAEDLKKYLDLDNFIADLKMENGLLESNKINMLSNILNNVEDTTKLVKIGESQLDEIASILQRSNKLAIKSINGTVEDADRQVFQDEMNQLVEQINNIVNTCEFNGSKLLDGTFKNKTIILGETNTNKLEISINNCDTNHIGKDKGIMLSDISTVQSTENTLESINYAIKTIQYERANLASIQNRSEHIYNYLKETKNILENKLEDENKKNYRLALAGLNQIQEILTRIREVEISAIAISDFQYKESFLLEINQLLQEIDRLAIFTTNNDIILLNGEFDENINATTSSLGISNIELNSVEEIRSEIRRTEDAIRYVLKLRKELADKSDSYILSNNDFEIKESLRDILEIYNGELYYIGNNENEKQWAKELGIKVK